MKGFSKSDTPHLRTVLDREIQKKQGEFIAAVKGVVDAKKKPEKLAGAGARAGHETLRIERTSRDSILHISYQHLQNH